VEVVVVALADNIGGVQRWKLWWWRWHRQWCAVQFKPVEIGQVDRVHVNHMNVSKSKQCLKDRDGSHDNRD
jgi:hypothetical protein